MGKVVSVPLLSKELVIGIAVFEGVGVGVDGVAVAG